MDVTAIGVMDRVFLAGRGTPVASGSETHAC